MTHVDKKTLAALVTVGTVLSLFLISHIKTLEFENDLYQKRVEGLQEGMREQIRDCHGVIDALKKEQK